MSSGASLPPTGADWKSPSSTGTSLTGADLLPANPLPPAVSSRGPRNWTESAIISTALRFVPSWASHSRHSSRPSIATGRRSEEHTSELQSRRDLVCRLLLEKKKKKVWEVFQYKEKKKST